jgi:hypothetical protein
MFGKPPSKLESLRGSLTDTVAGTFESIHEKLDDLPLERPLEKLKDVKETVAGTVVHAWKRRRTVWVPSRTKRAMRCTLQAARCTPSPARQRAPLKAQPGPPRVRPERPKTLQSAALPVARQQWAA